MENSVGSNMAMTNAAELLPTVVSNANVSSKEEKQIDIEENNSHVNLAITHCTGETQANLASVISHYVESVNQYNLRNLAGNSANHQSGRVYLRTNQNTSLVHSIVRSSSAVVRAASTQHFSLTSVTLP
ncbi:histidine decarboxylase [Spatholobus suberectus]|nr:histidine decarboxylase [Spatholobus suberectus]TKY51391.1 histidine decarboxylase [Spatholobus suberectus]